MSKNLENLSVVELRQEAAKLGIKNYSKMTKARLLDAINEFDGVFIPDGRKEIDLSKVDDSTLTPVVDITPDLEPEPTPEPEPEPEPAPEPAPAPEPEPKFLEEGVDRHGSKMVKGDRAKFRTGTRWFDGTVQKFKVTEDDVMVYGLIDGQDKVRLYLAQDVERAVNQHNGKPKVVAMTPSNIEEPVVPTEKGAAAKQLQEKIKNGVNAKAKKTPKTPIEPQTTATTSTTAKAVELREGGFKKTKYENILVKFDEERKGINCGDTVKFTISKLSKKNPGAEVQGKVVSFVWDTQDELPYFVIEVGNDKYFKTLKSVTKVG